MWAIENWTESLALGFLAAKHKGKYVQLYGSYCLGGKKKHCLGEGKFSQYFILKQKLLYKTSHRGC